MAHLKEKVKIADVKYPQASGWRAVWTFDHSSCHAAIPNDALDISKMNVNPGNKQWAMRDEWWGGKPQPMNLSLGVPKGILEERGIDTLSMKVEEMRAVLGNHPDLKNKKSSIEWFLMEEKGIIVYMLPKFHCELNPIEHVWLQSKRYMKVYCKYSNISSHKLVIDPCIWNCNFRKYPKSFQKSQIWWKFLAPGWSFKHIYKDWLFDLERNCKTMLVMLLYEKYITKFKLLAAKEVESTVGVSEKIVYKALVKRFCKQWWWI